MSCGFGFDSNSLDSAPCLIIGAFQFVPVPSLTPSWNIGDESYYWIHICQENIVRFENVSMIIILMAFYGNYSTYPSSASLHS